MAVKTVRLSDLKKHPVHLSKLVISIAFVNIEKVYSHDNGDTTGNINLSGINEPVKVIKLYKESNFRVVHLLPDSVISKHAIKNDKVKTLSGNTFNKVKPKRVEQSTTLKDHNNKQHPTKVLVEFKHKPVIADMSAMEYGITPSIKTKKGR